MKQRYATVDNDPNFVILGTSEHKNILIKTPPSTQKQSIGNELDDIGMLIMLGEAAVANNPDDFAMGLQLKSLQDREERLRVEYEVM